MRAAVVASGFVLAALAFAACSGGSSSDRGAVVDTADASAPDSPLAAIGPTFHKDIEPILQHHCQMCHVTGGIAPMPLVTYDDAQPFANGMANKTGARQMPPWGAIAEPDCTPPFGFKDDPSLTDAQIATIAAWANAGAPEGDPKDAPPPFTPPKIALTNPSVELSPPSPYALTDGNDQFRCFVLDPKVAATTYVDGLFVEPGNNTVVHHVLVFSDPTRASLAKITDQATQSYECFGSAGVPQQSLLAVWAPGTMPVQYPADVGAVLAKDTLLVMQIHYHPHSATATLTPDQTKFQMRYLSTRPSKQALTLLPGNFDKAVDSSGTGLLPGPDDPDGGVEFAIPADAVGHTETMQFTMPATIKGVTVPELPILGIGGHEHYVGVAERVTIHRPNPAPGVAQDQCLLNIPHWDFNWQRGYQFDTDIAHLPTIGANDVLTIKCTYDNTMNNPKVAQSLADQGLSAPRRVVLGETTLDEMCLAPAVLLIPNLN